jgi:geranylgeranyl diphosphate synthase type I
VKAPLDRLRPGDALEFTSAVDEELRRFLAGRQEELSSLAPDTLLLLDELARIVEAGGKRLRPTFCYWGHRAAGGRWGEAIVRAGAAIELLHTFALIHDDVMDRSYLRRGVPTTFRRLAGNDAAAERFGRSAAILVGDLAQVLADRMLAESGFRPDRVVSAFAHFNRMRLEAVSGQYLDLLSSRRSAGDEAGARVVAALKSGSYTVVGPLLLGAALAGGPAAVERTLAAYGRPLGEAFQLRDDVLGTFGDPALTGKDRDTDILEGKRTVLVAKAWQLGSADVRRVLSERLGTPDLSPDEVDQVRSAMRDSGALAEALALIDSLAAEAKASLAGSGLDPAVVEALQGLADLVAVRSA